LPALKAFGQVHLAQARRFAPFNQKDSQRIYTFDDDNRVAGEKIYYDRATVLRQLGMFHEPDGFWGRANAIVMHPVTMARILVRMIWRPEP
jgi:hypothetical protein